MGNVPVLETTYGYGWDRRPAKWVPALIELLRDDDGASRQTAAHLLGHFGRHAEKAVPALVVALEDPSACQAAAIALARIGPVAEQVVPALR